MKDHKREAARNMTSRKTERKGKEEVLFVKSGSDVAPVARGYDGHGPLVHPPINILPVAVLQAHPGTPAICPPGQGPSKQKAQ